LGPCLSRKWLSLLCVLTFGDPLSAQMVRALPPESVAPEAPVSSNFERGKPSPIESPRFQQSTERAAEAGLLVAASRSYATSEGEFVSTDKVDSPAVDRWTLSCGGRRWSVDCEGIREEVGTESGLEVPLRELASFECNDRMATIHSDLPAGQLVSAHCRETPPGFDIGASRSSTASLWVVASTGVISVHVRFDNEGGLEKQTVSGPYCQSAAKPGYRITMASAAPRRLWLLSALASEGEDKRRSELVLRTILLDGSESAAVDNLCLSNRVTVSKGSLGLEESIQSDGWVRPQLIAGNRAAVVMPDQKEVASLTNLKERPRPSKGEGSASAPQDVPKPNFLPGLEDAHIAFVGASGEVRKRTAREILGTKAAKGAELAGASIDPKDGSVLLLVGESLFRVTDDRHGQRLVSLHLGTSSLRKRWVLRAFLPDDREDLLPVALVSQDELLVCYAVRDGSEDVCRSSLTRTWDGESKVSLVGASESSLTLLGAKESFECSRLSIKPSLQGILGLYVAFENPLQSSSGGFRPCGDSKNSRPQPAEFEKACLSAVPDLPNDCPQGSLGEAKQVLKLGYQPLYFSAQDSKGFRYTGHVGGVVYLPFPLLAIILTLLLLYGGDSLLYLSSLAGGPTALGMLDRSLEKSDTLVRLALGRIDVLSWPLVRGVLRRARRSTSCVHDGLLLHAALGTPVAFRCTELPSGDSIGDLARADAVKAVNPAADLTEDDCVGPPRLLFPFVCPAKGGEEDLGKGGVGLKEVERQAAEWLGLGAGVLARLWVERGLLVPMIILPEPREPSVDGAHDAERSSLLITVRRVLYELPSKTPRLLCARRGSTFWTDKELRGIGAAKIVDL
jgi:hypothetical protein